MVNISRDERQDLCIDNWKKVGGRGTILAATGFGKTRIALKVIKRLIEKKPDASILVIVPTDYLKGQWLLQLAEWNLVQSVKVMIINSAIKATLQCDLMVCDEVHEYAADTFSKVFELVKYKVLLCLTGTINRLDGKEVLIKSYAPVCDEITLATCLANKWLADYKEYKILLEVDLTEYNKHNRAFLNHFSYFNYDFGTAMGCVSDYNIKLAFAKNTGNNVKDVTLHAMGFIRALKGRKDFVMNHPDKVRIADIIIAHREDKKIITFSQTKAMAAAIKTGVVMHSGQTKKKREKVMEEFNAAEKGVLNSAKALERGADIKGLSVSITLSFNSSSIAKQQKNGRSIRKEGDKESEIYTLVIKGTMEEEWFKNSAKGLQYLTIMEDQLGHLLNGEEYKTKQEFDKPVMFRF